jgi:hypothetical protein
MVAEKTLESCNIVIDKYRIQGDAKRSAPRFNDRAVP